MGWRGIFWNWHDDENVLTLSSVFTERHIVNGPSNVGTLIPKSTWILSDVLC